MKIIISNTVTLNGGDAAILLSIIDLFRNAFGDDIDFVIYDSQPEIASRYYPNLVFRELLYFQLGKAPKIKFLEKFFSYVLRLINLPRIYLGAWLIQHNLGLVSKILLSQSELEDINHYKSADIVVSTGGTYLVENYALLPRIFDYKVTLLMQRPLVFYTQSMGPFSRQSNRQILSNIFDKALLVLLRDELSYKYVQDLDFNSSNVQVSSDVVFSLANELDLKQACEQSFPKGSCLKIAISVRYWPHFKNSNTIDGMTKYKQAISAFTTYVVDKYQAEVTYISTCQGIPEYWVDDSKVAEEIFDLLPENIQKYVEVNNNFHTPKILLNFLKSHDLVVATRMHMAILALSAGTPVLPIAYEFKTQELFRRLGLGKWVQDIETTNAESITSLFDSFISALPENRQQLFAKVAQEREQALSSITFVKKAFYEWKIQNN
ncbi:MAG: polysaccharide pyruvyl transferase family protein [Scytonematopsis contorta HA4267-MV1]|jgi:colanic acid/amylovoran biosynthesis protein|nr:polysaccharide pyruvyl transferase family protein [Scytonematopsis contorta HA4267-MV1]